MSEENDVHVTFGGTIEGLEAAIAEAGEQVEALTAPLTELRESLAGIGEAFMAAFAVEKIGEFVEKVTETGAAVEHMKQQLGMSAEQISAFNFAAGAMGISSEGAGMALERLERNMASASSGTGPAAAAFAALGINVKNSEGNLESLDVILPEIADKFQETADGPAKTAVAIDLFGRAGAEMIPMLNTGSAGLAAFKTQAEGAGAVISGPMAEGMEETAQSFNLLGKASDGVGLTLYEAFKPAIDSTIKGLIDLVEGFNNALKGSGALHTGLTVLVLAFDGVVSAITLVTTSLQMLGQVFLGTQELFHEGALTIGQVMRDAFSGNMLKVESDFADGMDRMADILRERGEKLKESAAETAKVIAEQYSNISLDTGVDTSGGKAPEGEKEKPEMPDPGDGNAKAQSQVAIWQAALDQQLMAEQNFFADSKAEELAFWNDKLALTTAGSAEQLAVQKNIYTLTKEMAVAARAEDNAMAKDDAATTLALGKIKLQQEKDELNAEVDAKKQTAAQKIAAEKTLADQEYQLDLQALQAELSTLAEQPAEYQKVYNQILVLKAKHNQEMAALDLQAAAAQKQQLAQMTSEWQKALNPITSSFNSSIKGMINGTTSLRTAVANLATSMLNDMIDTITKNVEHWIAGELAKTAATEGGVAAQVAAWLFGDTAGKAAQSTAGATSVISAAAVAGANAFAATAAIPIVGPSLAPAAALAAEAQVMGFLPQASAAGGMWSLPSDMLVQAHAKESILPASISAPMRDFFEGGGAEGQGGGDTYHLHMPISVSAIDGPSVIAHANMYAPIYAKAVMNAISRNSSLRGRY